MTHRLSTGFMLLLAWSVDADTIELKTGERLEGTFKQASSAGVVIDIGGQAITMPLSKVSAIFFGNSSSRVSDPLMREALHALQAVQATTAVGVNLINYTTRGWPRLRLLLTGCPQIRMRAHRHSLLNAPCAFTFWQVTRGAEVLT